MGRESLRTMSLETCIHARTVMFSRDVASGCEFAG